MLGDDSLEPHAVHLLVEDPTRINHHCHPRLAMRLAACGRDLNSAGKPCAHNFLLQVGKQFQRAFGPAVGAATKVSAVSSFFQDYLLSIRLEARNYLSKRIL